MNKICPYKIEELLPHTPPAILIDKVINWDEMHVEVSVKIDENCSYYHPGQGVPAHVGIEYMAQACGAYAGLLGKFNNEPVRLGFLLGTRNFTCSQSWFKPGIELIVSAREIFRQDQMGCFACNISYDGQEVASAQLNVFQPENSSEFLASGK